jgi:hypothetical protein
LITMADSGASDAGASDAGASRDINVRSDSYLIACTVGTCPHCRAPTRLVALVLPPGHESLDFGVDADADVWEISVCPAFLFYVEQLSASVERRLKSFSAVYRLAFGAATPGPYWANHCQNCDSMLDDHDLFCEPEGAFLPTGPVGASAIELVRIGEAVEAAAGGYYACDFFESMAAD